jgi:hypothetical protein
MIEDIGGDKTGDRYALLNALYFAGYAPFSEFTSGVPNLN